MDISVVIVSYNVRAFLEKCLVSVYRSVGDITYDVFVVDNDSVDDSAAMVKEKFPNVNLIVSAENVGFARANNMAIKQATGEYILILNPDTVVSENTLITCFDFMKKNEDAGAIGVKMVDGTGTYLPESKRGLPSPLSSLFKITGINRLFPGSNFFNAYYLGGLDPEDTNEAPVLTGAFMFARGAMLKKIGGFDEDYFMYGEDIDLSFRILEAGYRNYYLPQTSIIHYKGESTKRSSLEYVKTFYNAMLIFVSKHYSGPKGALLKQFLRLGILLRAGLSGVKRFVHRLLSPLLDLGMIVLAIWAVKYYWSVFYFGDAEHFDANFQEFNLPIYSMIWLLTLALFGAYDRGRSIKRVVSGVAFGTTVILIVYGLLPEVLRSSRALILLTTPLIMLLLSLRTALMQGRGRGRQVRTVGVVGSLTECRRIMELLNRIDPEIKIAGAIRSGDEGQLSEHFIASVDALEHVVNEYGIDELIFSSSDVEFESISRWMTHFGSTVQYRIASGESDDMVGSDSKVSAGQLYTTELAFGIDDTLKRRNKRFFDFTLAVGVTLVAPVLIFLPGGRRTISKAFMVLKGSHTWVSYDTRDPDLYELPRIKPGFIFPSGSMSRAREIHTFNYLYAREYSVWKDLELVMRSGKQ